MKQKTLSSTTLVFMWLVIDDLVPSPKKEIKYPKYAGSLGNLTFSQFLAITYKPLKYIYICWSVGGGVTMKNKDTNFDYQKAVRAGGHKWGLVEIMIVFFFFFKFRFQYFLYREFLSPTWKESLVPEKSTPTQNPNLT